MVGNLWHVQPEAEDEATVTKAGVTRAKDNNDNNATTMLSQ